MEKIGKIGVHGMSSNARLDDLTTWTAILILDPRQQIIMVNNASITAIAIALYNWKSFQNLVSSPVSGVICKV